MEYDFSTLNDKEFEELSRDILNAKFKLDLQSFKRGRDKGVDLRYSTPKHNNSIVVQVKHYVSSPFPTLKSSLVKNELPKVKKLNPDRYIIVTSSSLSSTQKNILVKAMKPFIKSANDIFGKEDLNKYLKKLDNLEQKWHKLWLSSTTILQRILNNAVYGRSAFFEEKIRRNIRLYVPNSAFHLAYKILKDHKYILITGQGGVGKTTIAYYLSYQLLAEGYELFYIDGDVKEAEKVFINDPKKKQIFLFDDFLGGNYLELINPKTTESEFVDFLERVQKTPGKYLILTTRTMVYLSAIEKFEKLKRARVDIARKEIRIGDYDELDKAKILYNHLYHSDLPANCIPELQDQDQYWSVIRHRNYSPRLIEFICIRNNFISSDIESYQDFVFHHLNNPKELWLHPYRQFTVEERLLLHSVFIESNGMPLKECKQVFDSLLNYEVTNHHHRPIANPFKSACQKLQDGILNIEVNVETRQEKISFANPSIRDFLMHYFYENPEDTWKLIKGSVFIEQFETYEYVFVEFLSFDHIDLTDDGIEFCKHIISHGNQLRSYGSIPQHQIGLRSAAILSKFKYFNDDALVEEILKYNYQVLSKFDIDYLDEETWEHYYEIISSYDEKSPVCKFVKKKWKAILIALFEYAGTDEEFEQTVDLFKEYNKRFKSFINKLDGGEYTAMLGSVTTYVDSLTRIWILEQKQNVKSIQEWEAFKKNIADLRNQYFQEYLLSTDDYYNEGDFFDDLNYKKLIAENKKKAQKINEKVNISSKPIKDKSYKTEINSLFQK